MNLLKRHLIVGAVSLLFVYLFYLTRSEWHYMHAWNRAFADASLILLVITLVLGPASRIFGQMKKHLSWRRELGIWSAITAAVHVYILFDGWFEWQFVRMIAGIGPDGQLFFDSGFTLGNLLGIIALVYVLLLSLISNRTSIGLLSKSGWDYLQQKSSTLYVLAVVHTLFFLFFYRPENPNWLQKPFLITIIFLFALQWTVFFITVRNNKKAGSMESFK